MRNCWLVNLLLAVCYQPACAQQGSDAAGSAAKDELGALISDFWAWRLQSSPTFATRHGIRGYDDRLDEFTEEAFAKLQEDAEAYLARAQAVDRDSLDTQDKVNRDLLVGLLLTFTDGYNYRMFGAYNSINMLENPVRTTDLIVSKMSFENETDFRDLLTRYQALARQIDQIIDLMNRSIALGTTRHAVTMTGVVATFDREIATITNAVNTTSIYQPFNSIPATMPTELQDSLKSEAQRLLRDTVKPAWERLRNFTQDVYMQNTAQHYGVGELPNGPAYYQAALKWHISVDLTADQVHDIGLREVARIETLMQQEMDKDGFDGSLQDYIAHLRSNTDNFYHSEEAMLEGYRSIARLAVDKLPSILNKIPKAQLVVRPTPTPYSPTGSYAPPSADGTTPGVFYVNVFHPETKPKFDMAALTLHEAQPGHHTQVSYLLEESGLPDFRTLGPFDFFPVPFAWLFNTGYTEGWALYAESLGEEMGLYTQPHSLFGRYVAEIFRAVRLVVDTGIHTRGWSKERAMWLMANYTTYPASQIDFEINRYISWPGQACAYKIGEIRIRALRTRAQQQLGSKFDLGAFHDQILLLGPVPLSLLETHIDEWVAGFKTSAASARAPYGRWPAIWLFVVTVVTYSMTD